MEMVMMEAVTEKLRQLSRETIWLNFGLSSEVENLALTLDQINSLFKISKRQQGLLWVYGHDYDRKDDDLVKKLFYKADRLADSISGGFNRKDDDLVEKLFYEADHLADSISGGMFESFRERLFYFIRGYCSSTRERKAADLTRRIRLVNTRLLTKTAMAPHPPQGGQDQRAAGDLDADDMVRDLKEPDFLPMMAEDGCFFLLMAFSVLGGGTELEFPESDIVFGTGCVNKHTDNWLESMFFVGNQVPFIVIDKLMDLSFFKKLKKTLECKKKQQQELGKRTIQKFLIVDQNPRPMDLLHCLQSVMLGPKGGSNTAVGKKDDDIGENVSVSKLFESEVENLASALEQMKSLFKINKRQQGLLWFYGHDYDRKDDDLVKKLFYEADHLADTISGGVFERFRFSSCFSFWPNEFCLPTVEQKAADSTRRIRLVNTRLLTKIAIAPHPPQGGQDQRAAGDLDGDDDDDAWTSEAFDDAWKSEAFDDAYDTWKEGYSYLSVDDFVVGREDAIEEVICGLLSDDGKNKDDLKIISICGMPGIGKTTLARKLVHQDYSVRHHFDCIAWATVGKSFSTRHVLEDLLLHHLFLNRDDMNPYSDLDLAQKLYEFLQPKRYLIVLDDVWSIDAWVCLRIAFPPRETTGSRVLLTTRDTLVPEKIAASFHNMRRTLDQDGDSELLRRTAFRGDKPFTCYSVVHY